MLYLHHNIHYDVCKYSLTLRVVNTWNSLPDFVVDVDSVDVFKNHLDKFWSSQPLEFDWRVSLTGTGDRSESSFEKSRYVCLSIDIGDADIHCEPKTHTKMFF